MHNYLHWIYICYISNICPKIMLVVEELWNNTTSSYKNWHKKIKGNGKNLPAASSCAGPALCGLAGPVGQPSPPVPPPLSSSSWRRQKDRGTFPATSCFSLSSPGSPARRHAPPKPLSLSPVSPPPLVLSLDPPERCRHCRSPLP